MDTGEKILAKKLGKKIVNWKIDVKNEFEWKI